MIKAFDKAILAKSANDNIHCIATWKFVHNWSNREANILPDDYWNEQRAVHYLYEILNRPWLPDLQKIIQARAWLRYDRFSTANLILAPDNFFAKRTSGRTHLIYEHEARIEKEAELTGTSPYQKYIDLLKQKSDMSSN